MVQRISNRILHVCAVLVLIFTVFVARLINVQIVQHRYFLHQADNKNYIRIPILAQRGRILDRNGEELAINVPVSTVTADCSRITNPYQVAKIVEPFLNFPIQELTKKLSTKSRYIVLAQHFSEEKSSALIHALQKSHLKGIYLEERFIRSYPNNEFLCHVLGFVDNNGKGVDGIEKSFNDDLTGSNGLRLIEHDRKGREIVLHRGIEKPAEQGVDIRLTIDMSLQAIVEHELTLAYQQLHPISITSILANPKTGEILALACRPNFDPNHYNKASLDCLRNRAISDIYEPGSTFKIVVTSAAFNEKLVTDHTQIYCEYGHFLYGGKVLKDHHKAGSLTVSEILMYSSNIGAAKIALGMSDNDYYRYVRNFGFGSLTGITLPGEVVGLVSSPQHWDKLTKTRMAIGHSIAVTPIQMILAMSIIANGGYLMPPRLVLSKNEGNVIAMNNPIRNVISKKTTEFLTRALTEVVMNPHGTGKMAQVHGFTVAGKTGTANKINSNGRYSENKYIVSFIGFLPASNPQIVCFVMVDNPKVSTSLNYGGLVAAPIFANIMSQVACSLDMKPDIEANNSHL